MHDSGKIALFSLGLVMVLLSTFIIAISFGGSRIAFAEVIKIMTWQQPSSVAHSIIWQIRLPRVLLGFVVGALLGMAGAVSQGVFRNPLAEPGLIGVSGGASLAAVACIILWPDGPLWRIPLAAFVGGLLATHATLGIAKAAGSQGLTLILAGLAVNIIAGAGVGLGSYFADANQWRLITFWQLGSLSTANWPKLWITLSLLTLTAIPLLSHWRFLNALLLGESEARHLGFNVKRNKNICILWMALAVAAAVAFCGSIGFVGLIMPHVVRIFTGPNHKLVIPFSALAGGCFLVVADLVARALFAPLELPLGVITALVGGPVFISLMVRQHRRRA